ncbi:hypothetical protein J2S21_002064 [Peribacillus cavernae]|nr:hypothetical protein [Peribacillus cavernae]
MAQMLSETKVFATIRKNKVTGSSEKGDIIGEQKNVG